MAEAGLEQLVKLVEKFVFSDLLAQELAQFPIASIWRTLQDRERFAVVLALTATCGEMDSRPTG